MSSSTSGFGSFSRTWPDFGSSSRLSPARSFSPCSGGAQLDDTLLVGAADHERPVAVLHDLFEGDDLALDLEVGGLDDVQGLVQHDLLAALESSRSSTSGEMLTRSLRPFVKTSAVDVLVRLEEDPVAGRRLGELLDLFLQGDELLARLAQGGGQLLVVLAAP